MDSWRQVFRIGIAPSLPRTQLETLRKGLLEDDPRLIQGATTTPSPLACVAFWKADGACALGYGFAFEDAPDQGNSDKTVAEVEYVFSHICQVTDELLHEPGGIGYFIGFFDNTPRDKMRKLLLEEVDLALGICHAEKDSL